MVRRFVTSSITGAGQGSGSDPFAITSAGNSSSKAVRRRPRPVLKPVEKARVTVDWGLLRQVPQRNGTLSTFSAQLSEDSSTYERYVDDFPIQHKLNGPATVRIVNESQLISQGQDEKRHRPQVGNPVATESELHGFLTEHLDHRKHVRKLKSDLSLLQAAFLNVIMNPSTRVLFDQILSRARFLDHIWAAHFERVNGLCLSLYNDCRADQERAREQFANQVRVLNIKHAMEKEKWQREKTLGSPFSPSFGTSKTGSFQDTGQKQQQQLVSDDDSSTENYQLWRKRQKHLFKVWRGRVPGSDSESESEDEDDIGWTKTGAIDKINATPDTGLLLENQNEITNHNSKGKWDDLESPASQRRMEMLKSLTKKEIAQLIQGLQRDELFHLFSDLGERSLLQVFESVLHATAGDTRSRIFEQVLSKGKAIEIAAGDAQTMTTIVEDMSIANRNQMLAILFGNIEFLGLSGQSKRDFFASLDHFARGKDIESQSSCRSSDDVPSVSFKMRAQEIVAYAHQPPKSVSTSTDDLYQDSGGRLASFVGSIKGLIEGAADSAKGAGRSPSRASVSQIDVEGFEGLKPGGAYSISVVITEEQQSGHGSLFAGKSHPWDRVLRHAKTKRARDISLELLEETLVGEVYARKILLDQDMRKSGKRKELCMVTMDYFTQKYGLKKLSKEYTRGLVNCIRKHWRRSKRVESFGIVCGILQRQRYSAAAGNLATEYLRRLFGGHADVAKAFKAHAFVPMTNALHSAHQIYRVESLESDDSPVHGSGAADAVESLITPGAASTHQLASKNKKSKSTSGKQKSRVHVIKRYWTMPAALRSLLEERLNTLAAPACDIPSLKDDFGTVLYVPLDLALEAVLRLFTEKLEIDRKMLMHLFDVFDDDGNGVLSYGEFQTLIEACQPVEPLDDHALLELWDQVNEWDGDDDQESVTKEGFACACIAQGLQLNYWALTNVKDHLDILLKQAQYFDHVINSKQLR